MGNDGRDNDAKKAYEGVLNIEQKFGTEKRSGAKVSAFVDRIKKRMKQEPFHVDIPENRTVSYTACWSSKSPLSWIADIFVCSLDYATLKRVIPKEVLILERYAVHVKKVWMP